MAEFTFKRVTTVLLTAPLGGAVLTAERLPGPTTDEVWQYAPRINRPAILFANVYDQATEVRINYV